MHARSDPARAQRGSGDTERAGARLPGGFSAIVVDNGSTDGSGTFAAKLGAIVVHEPQRGFGAACWAGLRAANADIVAFMDCDGSLDPRDLPKVTDLIVGGAADLAVGTRVAPRRRVAASRKAREPGPRADRTASYRPRDPGHRPYAGSSPLSSSGPGAGRQTLRLAPRDGDGRGPRRLAHRHHAGSLRWSHGQVQGHRHRKGHVANRQRHDESAASVTATIVVIAKAPRPGLSKTRLTPPCTSLQAAALAEAALIDTLVNVQRTSARRRVLALEGKVGGLLEHLKGFEVIQQRGAGLDERLAAAFEDTGEPALLVGMDTPQMSPSLLDRALALLSESDAVLGDTFDGGYWAIGLGRPSTPAFKGVPMSTRFTACVQRQRLAQLGLSCASLPVLRDVDCYGDAVAVAAQAPESRFSRCFAKMRPGIKERSA